MVNTRTRPAVVNGQAATRDRGTKPRDPWYRMESGGLGLSAEILIYDEIDPYWGTSAATFARDLAALDADAITVRISSPGGDVYEALAMLNALRGHRARVTTVIDGLAASAASFVAMAGDEIIIGRNAEIMIHDASIWGGGNAAELRRQADNLDRISDNIASIYAERTGTEAAAWREAMRAETWYSAAEAVAVGLADRIDTAAPAEAAPVNRFDLSRFTYRGRASAPPPRTPSTTEAEDIKKGPSNMGLSAIAQRLGLAADADEATVNAALDAALAARPKDIEPVELPFNDADVALCRALVDHGPALLEAANACLTDGTSDDAKGLAQPIVDTVEGLITTATEALEAWGQTAEPEAPAAAAPAAAPATASAAAPAPALGAGVVAVSQVALDELRNRAARADVVEREAAVDSAVRSGRIAPADRSSWLARLAANPAEASVLAALTPVFPVGAELGHANAPADKITAPDDLSWFDSAPTSPGKA